MVLGQLVKSKYGIRFIDKISRKELAYFRKVNFLIPFFEETLFSEINNLEDLKVTKESIEELKNRCEQVLNDHTLAKDLLPTQSGFFFGSTNYDEYYYKNVENVLETCKTLLPEFDNLKDGERIVFNIWF